MEPPLSANPFSKREEAHKDKQLRELSRDWVEVTFIVHVLHQDGAGVTSIPPFSWTNIDYEHILVNLQVREIL